MINPMIRIRRMRPSVNYKKQLNERTVTKIMHM
jgi:hypothetical protein